MKLTDLIILLHTKSVSYCYYENKCDAENWIRLDVLKEGIRFALKNNLHVQFVYPIQDLPKNYKEIVNGIKHLNIAPCNFKGEDNTIRVFTLLNDFSCNTSYTHNCILHIKFSQIEETINQIIAKENYFNRLNIVIDDIESIKDLDMERYRSYLGKLSLHIKNMYDRQKEIHINLLTDRIFLHEMNNCNAGICNLTLAPNGSFYVCPAFYFNNPNDNIGNLQSGVIIKNKQLYQLEYAPICRICDAYQCKRCVWLNRKMTLEVNTPSHEQCIVSHIERNMSKSLLDAINQDNILIDNKIEEINYMDPFDKIK